MGDNTGPNGDVSTKHNTNDCNNEGDQRQQQPFCSKSVETCTFHLPISWSLTHNTNCADGQELSTACSVVCGNEDSDVTQLVSELLDHLKAISKKQLQHLLESGHHEYVQHASQLTKNNPKKYEASLSAYMQWLTQIPVIGFNSSGFDICLVRPWLFSLLSAQGEKFNIIKKGPRYVLLSTTHCRWLDILSYLAPGTSLKSFVATWGDQTPESTKLKFPYLWLKDVSQLEQVEFPSFEAFNLDMEQSCPNGKSSLICDVGRRRRLGGDQSCSLEDYTRMKSLYEESGCQSFKDYLILYNQRDTLPFHTAVVAFRNYLIDEMDSCPFMDSYISLPGLSLKIGLAYAEQTVKRMSDRFYTFSGQFSMYQDDMRTALTGGPSIVMHRYAERGVTPIRRVQEDVCTGTIYEQPEHLCAIVERVQGYDATSQYLGVTGSEHCVGPPTIYTPIKVDGKEDLVRYVRVQRVPICSQASEISAEWLACMERILGRPIQTARSRDGEKSLIVDTVTGEERKLDGFDPVERIGFFFAGCQYHVCVKCHREEFTAYVQGKTVSDSFLSKLQVDLETDRLVAPHCSKLVYMRECDWIAGKRAHPELKDLADRAREHLELLDRPSFIDFLKKQKNVPQSDFVGNICERILSDDLFGFCSVDIRVPDEYKNFFGGLQPIFKNTDLTLDHASDMMRKYALDNRFMTQTTKRKALVGSYWAEKKLISTPLLKWYLEHNLVIDKVHYILQYKRARPFKEFMDKVVHLRRQAARDGTRDAFLKALLFKLAGNSLYGRCCINPCSFKHVKLCAPAQAGLYVGDAYFQSAQELSENLYEMTFLKRVSPQNTALQIALSVYDGAKKSLLSFFYDCVATYVERPLYQELSCDTDSGYFAFARDRGLEGCIQPHLRRQFYEEAWPKFFPEEACSHHHGLWVFCKIHNLDFIEQECCKQHRIFDSFRPLTFKKEFEGDKAVCLCPKTSICTGSGVSKVTSKGLSKVTNKLEFDDYVNVLKTGERKAGCNESILSSKRLRGLPVSVIAKRYALSYLYLKKRVFHDGVTCFPTHA